MNGIERTSNRHGIEPIVQRHFGFSSLPCFIIIIRQRRAGRYMRTVKYRENVELVYCGENFREGSMLRYAVVLKTNRSHHNITRTQLFEIVAGRRTVRKVSRW